MYILHDSYEQSLGLPSGKYDVPLSLTAKFYNQDGTLWDPEANGELTSVFGDVIQVNGAPWPYMDVEPRKYRFRILNTGISRTFELYMEDDKKPGTKLSYTVIGSDCGLLEKSVPTTDLYISVAERWEIVMDFTDYAGKNITMKNAKGVGADSDFDGTDRVMSKWSQHSFHRPTCLQFVQNSVLEPNLPSVVQMEMGPSQAHYGQSHTRPKRPESTTKWSSNTTVAYGTLTDMFGRMVSMPEFLQSPNVDRSRFGS
jgi:FtsP/CotA-like multicopper oxidase with cupredoxin domain